MIEPAKIQVRFADCDVMGHVNNAVYLSYFEQARMHYFKFLVDKDWDWKKDGTILARNEINYRKPILLHDEPQIHVGLKEIGGKSFTLNYQIFVGGEVCADGKSTLVCFDYYLGKTVEVPAKLRQALSQLNKNEQL
ncbi:MAG: acyl-CoA thioesterase [Crocinitomicaceae bacterium]|nr:acyl-CoA thioesterase [Crocinitomicaceae bacterium]